MRLRYAFFGFFGAILSSSQPIAGTYSASQFSKTIAATEIAPRDDLQAFFVVRAGTFWNNGIEEITKSDGIYYQYFGTVEVLVGNVKRILYAGDGIFMPAGTKFSLKAIGAILQRTYLQFLLSPTAESDPVDQGTGASVEVYRSPSPVPGPTRDQNMLSLVRVPVPPLSPFDPPHARTGAALHYVVSGVGTELVDGKAAARGPGSVSYQPRDLFYQWANPGPAPLIYLVFNINPKNISPVVEIEDPAVGNTTTDPHVTWAIGCVTLSMLLTLLISIKSMLDRRGS